MLFPHQKVALRILFLQAIKTLRTSLTYILQFTNQNLFLNTGITYSVPKRESLLYCCISSITTQCFFCSRIVLCFAQFEIAALDKSYANRNQTICMDVWGQNLWFAFLWQLFITDPGYDIISKSFMFNACSTYICNTIFNTNFESM